MAKKKKVRRDDAAAPVAHDGATRKRTAKKARRDPNPMLTEFRALKAGWPADMRRVLSASLDDARRAHLWEVMVDAGDALRRRYAWAVPDERALRILEHFGPIVEVGAGKGYWASLLAARGVDVVAYDAMPPPDAFARVAVGGPDVLAGVGRDGVQRHFNMSSTAVSGSEKLSETPVCRKWEGLKLSHPRVPWQKMGL